MKRFSSIGVTFLLAILPSCLFAQGVGPNIDELAKELANPGAANATLNFKFEYRTFDGEFLDADDQDSFTTTFQPVFPFVLPNGNNLIFRPAFAYTFGQPAFHARASSFDTEDAFGDVAFDLLYAGSANGWTLGAGIEKNVEAPDAFASDWKFTFTFSPVIKNPFQRNPPSPPVEEATRAAVLAPIR